MASRFISTGATDRIFATTAASTGTLTARDRTLIEALLVDRGVFANPSVTPGVFTPTPAPTGPAAPTAPTAPGAATTASPIIRLALTTVKPGDLITAGFMNALVEALLALDGRLSQLEGADASGSPPFVPTPVPTPTPAPTPTPTPTPTPSLVPSIASVSATIEGGEMTIDVTGDNIEEGQVRRVLLGTTEIDLTTIIFDRAGFTFRTETAALTRARTPLTVTTGDGEDSALVTRGRT